MGHKPDKQAKRKAKLKARKVHAEQARQRLAARIADAIIDLCAAALPEYVDDSKGPDLVGRRILWRMGMVAWNIAVSGRKEIDASSIRQMRLDEESREMVRQQINDLIRRKYAKYPQLRTSVTEIKPVVTAGVPRMKVVLGETYSEMPIPSFDDTQETLTPEQILTKRKSLGLSQVKFAAALGVSVKKISAWEHGKEVPPNAELAKIAELFDSAAFS